MFHVELRQFPHVARAFNLTSEEVQARVVAPWAVAQPIDLQDRRWDPGRARLKIYEARRLASEEIGMGRGWGTVSREGEDVTERVLATARAGLRAPPAPDELKAEILARAAEGPVNMTDVLDLAGGIHADQSATERVHLARRAVLELLEAAELELSRPV